MTKTSQINQEEYMEYFRQFLDEGYDVLHCTLSSGISGTVLVTICEREDPRDAFVSNHYASIDELPHGSVVGTSSLRRQCQLAAGIADPLG